MRRLTGAELRPQAQRHLSFRPSAVASHTKNAAAGEARRVFKQKVYPAILTVRLRQPGCRSQHRGCGVPGIKRGSSRKPPSRRLRSCGAASLHAKGYMLCLCASRLTDRAYSPDYQICGRKRRQGSEVRCASCAHTSLRFASASVRQDSRRLLVTTKNVVLL